MLKLNIKRSILPVLVTSVLVAVIVRLKLQNSPIIERASKSIVKVYVSVNDGVDLISSGFIIKKGTKNSYIITNVHFTGRSLEASYEVTFYDGTKSKAYLFYADPYKDVAILLLPTSNIPMESEEVIIGDSYPQEGEEVFMFLQNGLYSFQKTPTYGQIINSFINIPCLEDKKQPECFSKETCNRLYSCYNIKSRHGISGSPVFNNKGELLIVSSAIINNLSIGFPILSVGYIIDAIKLDKRPVKRGIGASVVPLILSGTFRLFVRSTIKSSNNNNELKLRKGDYIEGVYTEDNQLIEFGKRFPSLDYFVQNCQQNKISLKVIRNGETLRVDADIFISKPIDEIVCLDDLKFFKSNLELSKEMHIPVNSIILNNSKKGGLNLFIVKKIGIEKNNGTTFFDIRSLEDITQLLSDYPDKDKLVFEGTPVNKETLALSINSKLSLLKYSNEKSMFERSSL